jgi:hypothetical protein
VVEIRTLPDGSKYPLTPKGGGVKIAGRGWRLVAVVGGANGLTLGGAVLGDNAGAEQIACRATLPVKWPTRCPAGTCPLAKPGGRNPRSAARLMRRLLLQSDFVILAGGVGEDECGHQLIMVGCVD